MTWRHIAALVDRASEKRKRDIDFPITRLMFWAANFFGRTKDDPTFDWESFDMHYELPTDEDLLKKQAMLEIRKLVIMLGGVDNYPS